MPEDSQNLDLSITLGNASFEASGPAEFVMQALDEFKGMASSASTTSGEEASMREEAAAATGPQESAASKVTLPQFLTSDAIKGNDKVATAIVAWAADHDNKVSLTAPDIKKYWRNTNVKVPANINRDVEKAQKHGWLTREDKNYSVTGFGRKAIELS